MIKLQTGISTNMDFIKALKERGVSVNAEFPAETLRDQLDSLDEETKVSFDSTNETILKVVNEGEEPTEKVTITFDVTGLEEGDEPLVTVGEEVITTLPAELEEDKDTELPYSIICTGYNTVEGTLVFDKNKEITIELEKEIQVYNVTIDLNGGTYEGETSIVESSDEGTTSYDLNQNMINNILPDDNFVGPEGKEFGGLTTVKDDNTTIIDNSFLVEEDITLYVLWVDQQ